MEFIFHGVNMQYRHFVFNDTQSQFVDYARILHCTIHHSGRSILEVYLEVYLQLSTLVLAMLDDSVEKNHLNCWYPIDEA